MSRWHGRDQAPGSGVPKGITPFVPNLHTNQLVLLEHAGINTLGLACKAADAYLSPGYTYLRVPEGELRELIRQRVWMRNTQLPRGRE